MPTEVVSSARSCAGSKLENTTTCRRARVTATLSRRSPPARFSGPKFNGSTPRLFTLNAVEKKIDVALVALHVLQVLHEQALVSRRRVPR